MSDYRAIAGPRDVLPDRLSAGATSAAPMAASRPLDHSSAAGSAPGFRWLTDTLRRNALLIFLVVVVIDAIVAAWLFMRPPSYTASAEVLIEADDRGFGNLREEVDFRMERVQPADMESEVRILSSRKLALTVVDRLKIRDEMESRAAANGLRDRFESVAQKVWELTAGIRASFAGYVTSDREARIDDGRRSGGRSDEALDASESAVLDRFYDHLRIRRDPLARVIAVEYTASDPEKAARVVNALTAAYLEERVGSQRESLKQTAAYMRERLRVLAQELEDAEKRVKAFQSRSNLYDVDGRSVAERRYGELSKELTSSTVQLADAKSRLAQVSSAVRSGKGLGSVREVATSPVIGDLRRQEAELARRIADLGTQFGQRHPQMLNAKAELEDVRRSISAEIDRIIASLQNEVTVAEERVSRLRSEAGDAEKKLSVVGTSQVELRELDRKAEAARKVYETMLDRYQRATEQQSVLRSAARIISEASPPNRPSDPSKLLILGFATIGSLGFGAGLAFLRELRRRGYEHSQDLEETIGLPVLAVLPLLKSRGAPTPGEVRGTSTRLRTARAVYIESVQRIATRLLVGDGGPIEGRGRVVVMTSSFPAEGKTTISLSVARQCARSGRRTLLIDCDLRRRSLERLLDLSGRQTGLVQLLTGACADPNEATTLDQLSDLRIMPACGTPETPMQLLSSPTMSRLLDHLRSRYDMIIVDAPPVLAVSDVLAMSRSIDDVLFVVRWQRTPRDAVTAAIRELASVDVNFAGLVLNAVDVKSYSKYGRADHLYYAQHYDHYYSMH